MKYVAEDGTPFETEKACRSYEEEQNTKAEQERLAEEKHKEEYQARLDDLRDSYERMKACENCFHTKLEKFREDYPTPVNQESPLIRTIIPFLFQLF